MTKQELIEDLKKMPADKLHELLECVQQEIVRRCIPNKSDMEWARETLKQIPPYDRPAGSDPGDSDLPIEGFNK